MHKTTLPTHNVNRELLGQMGLGGAGPYQKFSKIFEKINLIQIKCASKFADKTW